MNILFNYGEHFHESAASTVLIQILIAAASAYIGFLFALRIYHKNKKYEKEKEQANQLSKNTSRIKYFNLLIDNIIEHSENQIESINNHKIQQESNLLIVKPLMKVATNDFKRLLQFDKDFFDTFIYFKERINIDLIDIQNLGISIDFIEGNIEELNRITEVHLKDTYKNSSDIKQNIELIAKKLIEFLNIIERKTQRPLLATDKDYQFAKTVLNNYEKLSKAKADFPTLKKAFLEPLLNEISKKYMNISAFYEISFLAQNSLIRMDDIQIANQNIIKEYSKIETDISDYLREISNINTQIKKIHTIV